MNIRGMPDLLVFLELLRGHKLHFSMRQNRCDTITVAFVVVGGRIEVDFFDDHIEYSVFKGDEGVLDDQGLLMKMIEEQAA